MTIALFPGQGSQHIGMGKFLYENFKIAKDCFEEASDTINLNFKKLCFDSDEKTLALTENTQPAIVLVSTCTWRLLESLVDLKIDYTAGHSVGEYSALVASKVISFEDALKAVRKRGQAMQSAVPVGEGSMLAVMGLSQNQSLWLCQWAEKQSGLSPLEAANFNSPGQIVISGSSQITDWLKSNFNIKIFENYNGKEALPKKVKLIPLKVSAPFHCSLMEPAQKEMKDFLQNIDFGQAEIPVIQNLSAQAELKADKIRQQIIEQITQPVRWLESMETASKLGVENFIEFGSGKVLSGLQRKINKESKTYNINSLEDLKNLESKF